LAPLSHEGLFSLPQIPSYATNNGHLFYIICSSLEQRQALIDFLKKRGISALFHYLPLHQSPYYEKKHDGRKLPNAIYYSRCLLRLPLYVDLSFDEVDYILEKIIDFFNSEGASFKKERAEMYI
jgi:dTDP-4-amino-4,6-dideoxygalactose transaminase